MWDSRNSAWRWIRRNFFFHHQNLSLGVSCQPQDVGRSRPSCCLHAKNFVAPFRTFFFYRYQLPSRNHVSENLLRNLYTSVQSKLQAKIKMALTTDVWTSINHTGFITLTCHYWDDDQKELNSAVLQCSRVFGSHTAEKICAEVWVSVCKYELQDKVIVGVTDNASNVSKVINDVGSMEAPVLLR